MIHGLLRISCVSLCYSTRKFLFCKEAVRQIRARSIFLSFDRALNEFPVISLSTPSTFIEFKVMRYVPFGLYLLFLFLFRWKTAHFIGPSSCCLRSDVSFLNLPFSSEDFLFSLSSLLCWHHHIICFLFCQTLFLSFCNIQNISLFSDFCMFFEDKTDRRNHAGNLLDSSQSGYSQSASLLVGS